MKLREAIHIVENIDPRCFHDLIRLEQMMNEESKN